MKRTTKDDAIDWFGCLERSTAQARELRTGPTLGPEALCLCGSNDTRGRIVREPIDLTGDDVTAARNEGQRPCRACRHGIAHGAMAVVRHYEHTNTVRDHFHPSCVRL